MEPEKPELSNLDTSTLEGEFFHLTLQTTPARQSTSSIDPRQHTTREKGLSPIFTQFSHLQPEEIAARFGLYQRLEDNPQEALAMMRYLAHALALSVLDPIGAFSALDKNILTKIPHSLRPHLLTQFMNMSSYKMHIDEAMNKLASIICTSHSYDLTEKIESAHQYFAKFPADIGQFLKNYFCSVYGWHEPLVTQIIVEKQNSIELQESDSKNDTKKNETVLISEWLKKINFKEHPKEIISSDISNSSHILISGDGKSTNKFNVTHFITSQDNSTAILARQGVKLVHKLARYHFVKYSHIGYIVNGYTQDGSYRAPVQLRALLCLLRVGTRGASVRPLIESASEEPP
jgi:hypothetical protein